MWHARPLDDQDIPAVVAMVNACELADAGEVMLEEADLVADLAHADRERDAVVVLQSGRIVAWAMVWQTRKRMADVHPDARGQGIGEWLLRWSAWRAKALGADRIGQTIDDARSDVAGWLAAHGYTARHTSWVLAVPAAECAHAATPATAQEVDEVLDLFESASSEHPDRLPLTHQAWRAATVDRPGFQPSDLMVIREDGRPVAAVFLKEADEIWLDKLAVSARARGRGYARQLLDAARDRAAAAGHTSVRLSDSNAADLDMYTRLGMTVERSYTHWALDL